jgi:hypothetical protein
VVIAREAAEAGGRAEAEGDSAEEAAGAVLDEREMVDRPVRPEPT